MAVPRVLAVVPGAVLLLGACTPSEVDVAGLEKEIVADVHEQMGQTVTVDCPGSVAWHSGGSFTCGVTTATGQKVKADVTMNDAGDVTWELES